MRAFKLDTTRERIHQPQRGEEEDTCLSSSALCGLEGGKKASDAQSVGNMVGGGLVFVPVRAEGGIGSHGAGVDDQNIKFGGL